jgi:hypothetical protein
MIMSNNERRRALGAAALRPYSPKTEGSRTAMTDLFSDVIHHVSADLTIEEIRSAFEMAVRHWEAEEQNSEDIL